MQNLGSCFGNMQFSVCCICDPYAISTPHTHVQLTFPSYLVNLAGRALADDEENVVHEVVLWVLSFFLCSF